MIEIIRKPNFEFSVLIPLLGYPELTKVLLENVCIYVSFCYYGNNFFKSRPTAMLNF